MAHTPTKKHTAQEQAKAVPKTRAETDDAAVQPETGKAENSDQPESPVPESEAKRLEAEAEYRREHDTPAETWGERQARESIEAERELARSGRSPQTDIKQDEGQK
jgi:hypothetical protein